MRGAAAAAAIALAPLGVPAKTWWPCPMPVFLIATDPRSKAVDRMWWRALVEWRKWEHDEPADEALLAEYDRLFRETRSLVAG